MPNREFLKDHPVECSFLIGRFMVEHLVRVYRAFDGDICTAVVLGTIAHCNYQRFYDDFVVHTGESIEALAMRGEHLPLMRPCNAMSISDSTGIPRETVRRKIDWLLKRGWVRKDGRANVFVTPNLTPAFVDFDHRMLEDFGFLLASMQQAQHRIYEE